LGNKGQPGAKVGNRIIWVLEISDKPKEAVKVLT